jgi:hypothetical protein
VPASGTAVCSGAVSAVMVNRPLPQSAQALPGALSREFLVSE